METTSQPNTQAQESNSRKRTLSKSGETSPQGRKQIRMSNPSLPTPEPTPTQSDNQPLDAPPDLHAKKGAHEEPTSGNGQKPETEEEACNISDLEFAKAKGKIRTDQPDPFTTPTPGQHNKTPSSSIQAAPEQKRKEMQTRDPIGQPPRPNQETSRIQNGKHTETKKPPQKGPGSASNQKRNPGQTENATTTGNPSSTMLHHQTLPTSEDGIIVVGDFKYTEYPRNKPHLYPQLGHNNLLHHQPQQILSWTSKKGNKVLARIFHARYEVEVEARMRLRAGVNETLSGFLGSDATFGLSDPKVDPLAKRNRTDPPWHTLVYDLSDAHFLKLLAHPIVATDKCVLIISPFHQIIPMYLTSITGLTCQGNSTSDKRIATEAVRQGLTSDKELASDIDLMAGTGSFQRLLDRLNVYFVNTSESRPNEGWWNIESAGVPKNISIEQYQGIVSRIKKLTFPTNDNGDGSALTRSRECINCKCISHIANLCPLYNMKGWLGPPKPTPNTRNNEPSTGQPLRGHSRGGGGYQAKRGQGNRGRGAGRGRAKRG